MKPNFKTLHGIKFIQPTTSSFFVKVFTQPDRISIEKDFKREPDKDVMCKSYTCSCPRMESAYMSSQEKAHMSKCSRSRPQHKKCSPTQHLFYDIPRDRFFTLLYAQHFSECFSYGDQKLGIQKKHVGRSNSMPLASAYLFTLTQNLLGVQIQASAQCLDNPKFIRKFNLNCSEHPSVYIASVDDCFIIQRAYVRIQFCLCRSQRHNSYHA